MKTIALVTQKGGAGKTTLAASVAIAAQEAGEKVYIVDMDPQGSMMAWGKRRKQDTPPVDQTTPALLPNALKGLRDMGYTLAVIDTAGIDTAATAAAMNMADLTLIPSRPSVLDIDAAKPTMQTLNRLEKPFAFILNCCAPNTRSARMMDAARALSLLNVLAEPFIVQRNDHMDAMALGLGVTEHDPNGKAAEEVRELWSWIRNRIGA